MFNSLRLWINILLGMALAIVLAIGLLAVANLRNLNAIIFDNERSTLSKYADAIEASIAAETRLAETLSALTAGIPAVQEAFARGDRDWLREQLLPAYQILADRYGAVQFQFHTPPATSFLRLHLIEKYGDDLSSFRHSVVKTNQGHVPQRGLEIGVADLGARGMVPVIHDGQHLGSVEFGMSFGPAFFDAFKAEHGVDAAVYLQRAGGLETFATTYGETRLLTPEEIQAALDGQPQQVHRRLHGQPVAVHAEAVHDYSGTPIGVVVLAMDRAPALAALRQAHLQALLVGVVAIVFGLALALVIARALAARMRQLAAGMAQVAAGDLRSAIALAGADELAELGQAADRMRQHLHTLVSEFERHARAVRCSAEDIAASVDSQAAAATEISASVAEITATVEELSSSSTQIADYANKVEAIARRNEEDSQQGAEAMQRLAASMEAIRRDNQRSRQQVQELGGRSRDIASIMEIIETLTSQTRMIAFNAALEASSAGESGKRFAVVAGEIRRFADSVSASTGDIGAQVEDIQALIARLTTAAEQEAATIDQGLAESASTAALLHSLVEAAGQTTTSARQINIATQQQKTASSQVAIALREIVSASTDTAGSVQRLADVARHASELAAGLNQEVARFRLVPRTPN